MTSREKRALAGKGLDWRTVEAGKHAEAGVIQLDFSGRVLTVEDGQVRLALEGMTAELALTYHTVAAMFLARDDRIPRGKVKVPWADLERFLKESVNLALDGKIMMLRPDGSVGPLRLEGDDGNEG
jgi:hypothetical protein